MPTTDPIGRADYVLGIDREGVTKGVAAAEADIVRSGDKVEKEYAKTGERAGKALSKGVTTGLKVLAGASATAFAFATKGVVELDSVVADFTADTGASADEAGRAGKAINAMAGRNIQPVREIGAALSKVHTDLGLVGEEAEQTTQRFLTFARATKQDAAAAVLAFDDILDAWSLTAADSGKIMDYLVASHQKYGGSIEGNQRALAQLAPQLRALNLDWRDGANLLNLFAASGLDASKAQLALNSAIQKLPAGESLDEFLVRLSKIEDDGERARVAIDIFGGRGGAGLANAIRPGISSLDDFGFSLGEVEGKSDDAAAALDSTFGARAQKLLNGFKSALTGVGQEFGPVLTGLASAASLGAGLGLDKGLAKAWNAVKNSSVVQGAAALAGGVIGGVYGAAAAGVERLTDLIKEGWSELGDSALVKAASAKAGAVVGAVFGAAAAATEKLASAFTKAFTMLPFAGQVRAAVLAAGMQIGILMGGSAGEGLLSGLKNALAGFSPGAGIVLEKDQIKTFNDEVMGELRKRGVIAGEEGAAAVGEGFLNRLTEDGTKLGEKVIGLVVGTMLRGVPEIERATFTAATAVSSSIAQAGPGWEAIAREQARRAGSATAAGIRDRRDAVDQAWQDMLDGLKHQTSRTTEVSKLIGKLAADKLIEGLNSKDEAVRAQSAATKQLVIDQLRALAPSAKVLTKEAMENLRKAMDSADPDIARAATEIYNAAIHGQKNNGPADLPSKTKPWGTAAVANFIAGLESKQHALETAASRLAGAVGSYLKVSSPAEKGALSLGGGPEGWGRRIVDLAAKGITGGIPAIERALASIAMPAALSGAAIEVMATGRAATTVRVEHTITAAGAANLAAAGFDAREVGRALADGADASGLFGNLRSLQAMTSG